MSHRAIQIILPARVENVEDVKPPNLDHQELCVLAGAKDPPDLLDNEAGRGEVRGAGRTVDGTAVQGGRDRIVASVLALF